ncbi:MAG: hypothetical protein ACE5IR_16175 [bacterium]
MKLKKYKIQGIELEQKPLTIGQFMAFGKLLAGFEIKLDMNFISVIGNLVSEKPLEFMRIVLRGQEIDKVKWEDEPLDTMWEVIEDFLLLNPGLKDRFQKLFDSLISRFVPRMRPEEDTLMN